MCPYCGEEILSVAKKCKHCDEWLKEDAPPASPPKRICPVCAEEMEDGLATCPHCSEPLQRPGKARRGSTEEKGSRCKAKPEKDVVFSPQEKTESRSGAHGQASVVTCFWTQVTKHYADFKGTASRSVYWKFVLFYYLLTSFLSALCFLLFSLGSTLATLAVVLLAAVSLGLIIPALSISVRRLHDIGKRGYWLFINFVPVIGCFWLLALLVKKGKNPSSDTWKKLDSAATAACILLTGLLLGLSLKNAASTEEEDEEWLSLIEQSASAEKDGSPGILTEDAAAGETDGSTFEEEIQAESNDETATSLYDEQYDMHYAGKIGNRKIHMTLIPAACAGGAFYYDNEGSAHERELRWETPEDEGTHYSEWRGNERVGRFDLYQNGGTDGDYDEDGTYTGTDDDGYYGTYTDLKTGKTFDVVLKSID